MFRGPVGPRSGRTTEQVRKGGPMPRVVVAAVKEGNFEEALQEVFRPFGGAEGVLGGRREAFIKVNAVDFKPYCHTDPRAVRALAAILYRAGARRVYVMDNCTQGNFTRLVFRVSGLERAAREAGAVPLYLDEGRQVEVTLPTLGYRVHVSRWVKERLMEGGDENLYISLPKLKTHSMATVTLGVKNQFGLIMQSDRIRDHNWNLHRKFADIFMLVRPHFTVIEGLHALNHGHYAPEGLAGDCVEELGVFIGGEDTLAVDAVGADLLGIDPRQVEHLRLAAEEGLGCIDLEAIEVIGDRGPFRRRYTPELLPVFPPDVRILEGAERCCPEGCSLNTRMVLQMLYVDFHGRGGVGRLGGPGTGGGGLRRRGGLPGTPGQAGQGKGPRLPGMQRPQGGAGKPHAAHGDKPHKHGASSGLGVHLAPGQGHAPPHHGPHPTSVGQVRNPRRPRWCRQGLMLGGAVKRPERSEAPHGGGSADDRGDTSCPKKEGRRATFNWKLLGIG